MSQINQPLRYIDKEMADALVEKWSPVLDSNSYVRPIEDQYNRVNTSILLENQERWCFGEANQAASGGVFGSGASINAIAQGGSGAVNTGDNYATGDARLPKMLIPIIRRTFPELISNEVVGVQPMSGPVGLAFALRHRYADQNVDGNASANTGADQGSSTIQAKHHHASNLYSPPGKEGALRGTIQGELGHNTLDTRFTGTSSSDLTGNLFKDSANTDVVAKGIDAGIAQKLSEFEFGKNIPTIELSLDKTAVEAGTRRLGARWSVELEQDLKNMNGVDADSELVNAMSYEIQAEIDREMIIRMIRAALSDSDNGSSTWNVASADGRYFLERNAAFYQKVIIEANRMAVRNRRGSANFIIATPRVCSLFEAMTGLFQWHKIDGNVNTAPVGIGKVGTVGGRFTIYRDNRTESQYSLNVASDDNRVEYALLGYKGQDIFDCGIIYCPYIPVMIQRTIDHNGFFPKIGILTRYGVVDNLFGAMNYYHLIHVTGMNVGFNVNPAAGRTILPYG